MGRTESLLVRVILAILCPVSMFIAMWWVSAASSIYRWLPISDSTIGIMALAGLALGLVLDVLFLRRWTAAFYRAGVRPLVLLYLFWSAVAVAFLMGLPVGNLGLGTLAGVYVGRRQRYQQARGQALVKAVRNASLFTAVVTGAEALPIGLLALHEQSVVDTLRALFRLDPSAVAGPLGIALIVLLCLLLMAVQFGCAQAAAVTAFGLGRKQ
jgi:hypothetical protein